MDLKIFRIGGKKNARIRTGVMVAGIAAYFCLFAAAYFIFIRQPGLQAGQLAAGQQGQTFNHSLDLLAAAKNIYPSGPLTIVRDVGTSDGISTKLVSFNVAADGLTEFGLMTVPDSSPPPGGYPAIILCHGYENPAEYSTTGTMLNDMYFYSSHGFAVIKPDYRGQGFSVKSGQPNSAYYSIDYNTDVMSLISALKKSSFINKQNLNLFGHSMGAYIALRAAVLSPAIKNLILLSGPVDSLGKMYLAYIPPSDFNNLNALKSRNEVIDKYGVPAENTAFWRDASPINLVQRIKAHIQIHVGGLDQVVPPEFSADLDAALTAKHIKHDYYVYPDGNHSLETQRSLIWTRSLQLLQPAQSIPARV
jgi:dipeptidyl aminopeptidase/acylaminoacyl peptidase